MNEHDALIEELRQDLISNDNENGLPMFGSGRVVSFGITALASLIRDIFKTLGPEKAAIICYRCGFEAGIAQALVVMEHYHFNGPHEFLRICEAVKIMSA
jgi:hypothetical protein